MMDPWATIGGGGSLKEDEGLAIFGGFERFAEEVLGPPLF